MKKSILFIIISFLIISCNHRSELADAYGNFEAEDIVLTSEATGKILFFDVKEGNEILKDSIVGVIDTMGISIQIAQVNAKVLAVKSKVNFPFAVFAH